MADDWATNVARRISEGDAIIAYVDGKCAPSVPDGYNVDW